MTSKSRVAIATNCIPDYRYPALRKIVDSEEFSFRLFLSLPLEHSCEEAREHLPLKFSFGFNPLFTSNYAKVNSLKIERMPIPVGLAWDLIRFWPTYIVTGDFGLRSLMCWAIARLIGARLIIWSEEIATSVHGRSALQRGMRKFLANRADSFLAWGSPAVSYLESIGVTQNKIHECFQAINNDVWTRRAAALDRNEIRKELGFDGRVFLLVGQLVQRKGFENFLHAWSRLPSQLTSRCMAVIVGSGDQQSELKEIALAKGLHNVRFEGSLKAETLVRYYVGADVFVFPSLEDVWGMVVNEALCCGLPVLASVHAGASQGLIEGRMIGQMFDPANIDDFVEHLQTWVTSPPPISHEEMREIVSAVTQEKSALSILSALRS